MAKKRIQVPFKTQLERAERKGHKKGMAELYAILSAADAGHRTEDSNSYENECEDYGSCYFQARVDAALLNAAKEKNIELVLFLLKAGANANTFNGNDRTPLFIAVEEGHIDLVKALLKAGASPNLTHEDQWETPLSCAMEKGHTAIAIALLAAGADVHQGYQPGEGPGLSINYTAEGDQVELTRAFVKAGAYVGPDVDDKWTPLMSAAYSGKTKSAALLIKAGSDVNAEDEGGDTVLMNAAEGSGEGALDTIRLLLKAGAKINYKNQQGRTALMSAAKAGRSEAVRLLLAAGADVFIRAKLPPAGTPDSHKRTLQAFDVADDDAVKEIIKSEMHRRIAAALSVLPLMPADVRHKILQLYLEVSDQATHTDSDSDDSR